MPSERRDKERRETKKKRKKYQYVEREKDWLTDETECERNKPSHALTC